MVQIQRPGEGGGAAEDVLYLWGEGVDEVQNIAPALFPPGLPVIQVALGGLCRGLTAPGVVLDQGAQRLLILHLVVGQDGAAAALLLLPPEQTADAQHKQAHAQGGEAQMEPGRGGTADPGGVQRELHAQNQNGGQGKEGPPSAPPCGGAAAALLGGPQLAVCEGGGLLAGQAGKMVVPGGDLGLYIGLVGLGQRLLGGLDLLVQDLEVLQLPLGLFQLLLVGGGARPQTVLLQGIQLLPGVLQLPAGLGVAAVQVLAGQLAVELLLGLKGIPPTLKVGLPGL